MLYIKTCCKIPKGHSLKYRVSFIFGEVDILRLCYFGEKYYWNNLICCANRTTIFPYILYHGILVEYLI